MGAFALFQDEPDEDSGPELFQDEKDEGENFLFQDEPPERGDQAAHHHRIHRFNQKIMV